MRSGGGNCEGVSKSRLYSWKHSGFNVHAGQAVPPEAKADLEDLAHYILRNPFSVEKMTLESPGDIVIYRSRLLMLRPGKLNTKSGWPFVWVSCLSPLIGGSRP